MTSEDKKEIKGEDVGLGVCRCGNYYATEPHTCPYAEEINNNSEDLCTCCDNCTYECARDI